MRVLDRYLIREISITLLAVVLVLLVIFLSNRLVHYLADVATGDLTGAALFSLLGLKVVKYVILLLPIALFISILMVMGRLHRDSELIAMAACGLAPAHVYKPVFMLAVPLAILLGWMSLVVVPHTSQLEAEMLRQAQRDLELGGITAGQFRHNKQKGRVIYVENLDEQGGLENIFIRMRLHGRPILLSSPMGELEDNKETGQRVLTLINGYRYDGVPGQAGYKVMHFGRHSVQLAAPELQQRLQRRAERNTSELWASNTLFDKAELQWRIATPISILVLALLAPAMSRLRPRSDSFTTLIFGILLFIVYLNLMALGKSWVGRSVLPVELGMNLVHGLFILLSLVLMMRQYGYPRLRTGSTKGRVQKTA
ncbi:MAG TPA: LPS export ABC transporter permease LptF [Gammaproteobacteria bacterium]|nr:LPS export ABC transporter permease LptF [Gammaproteobacteria bacterium]